MSKILIVDDSASIRQLVQITLQGAGYNSVLAEDGDGALAKIIENDINLVICDVNMPRRDGLSFVRELKQNSKYQKNKFTPVILLTTVAAEDKKKEGQQAGARAWIVKPFLPASLISAVERLLPA